MDKNMDANTEVEYFRLQAGPQSGHFTFLHHNGPILDQSSNVMERVKYILQDKIASEHCTRLRHIQYVPPILQKAYEEAGAAAERALSEARATAWKAFEEAIAPTVCQEAITLAEKAYEEAIAPTEKAYEEAGAAAEVPILSLIPNCQWNGRSIL